MNTDLKLLAERLGIAKYPEALNEIFDTFCKDPAPLPLMRTLEFLQKEFEAFGEHYPLLLRGAEELLQNKDLLTWLTLAYAYCKEAKQSAAGSFPLPPRDDGLATASFPALLLSLELPEAAERYRARGFDEEAIQKNIRSIGGCLNTSLRTRGEAVLNPGLYNWMTLYTKACIMDYEDLNFQVTQWKDEAILLRHRQSGELVFLLCKGSFTAHGTLAGLRGKEEEPPFLDVTLEETETAFLGYRAEGQRIRTVRERFEKSEWETVLREGDDVISLHIPRGADLTPAHVESLVARGTERIKRYYPECDFKHTVCTTWMLDPKLLSVLGKESKIAAFARHFFLHPSGDTSGNACLGFVWPGENCPIEELSEGTSLRRGIKAMMLRGDFIFWTTGVWQNTPRA